jgi:ABC-type dipeptide/oligopeptide/nickel transport system ATPase subunit
MKRVQNNLELLKLLCKCKKKMLKAIIQTSDKELVYCICECILNIVNGNVKVGDEEIKKLKKYKNVLRELLSKYKPMKSKKKILIQHGSGFLPILIPTIFQALATLLN